MDDIPRTKHEACLDASYAAQLHLLHRCIYRRVRTLLALVTVAAGTAAVTSALQQVPGGVTAAAILVALCGTLDVVCNFTEKAVKHELLRKEYVDLLARLDAMNLADFDAIRLGIQGRSDNLITSLSLVAFNDNVRSNGHEDWVRPENRMERFMRAVA